MSMVVNDWVPSRVELDAETALARYAVAERIVTDILDVRLLAPGAVALTRCSSKFALKLTCRYFLSYSIWKGIDHVQRDPL